MDPTQNTPQQLPPSAPDQTMPPPGTNAQRTITVHEAMHVFAHDIGYNVVECVQEMSERLVGISAAPTDTPRQPGLTSLTPEQRQLVAYGLQVVIHRLSQPVCVESRFRAMEINPRPTPHHSPAGVGAVYQAARGHHGPGYGVPTRPMQSHPINPQMAMGSYQGFGHHSVGYGTGQRAVPPQTAMAMGAYNPQYRPLTQNYPGPQHQPGFYQAPQGQGIGVSGYHGYQPTQPRPTFRPLVFQEPQVLINQRNEPFQNPPIHCSEVKDKEFIFQYSTLGSDWFVLRCPRPGTDGQIKTYAWHPLWGNRARTHLKQNQPCHDIGFYGSDEELVRRFGHRVYGEELCDQWVNESNINAEAAAGRNSRSGRAKKEVQSEVEPEEEMPEIKKEIKE